MTLRIPPDHRCGALVGRLCLCPVFGANSLKVGTFDDAWMDCPQVDNGWIQWEEPSHRNPLVLLEPHVLLRRHV